jgi:hypothetical protein
MCGKALTIICTFAGLFRALGEEKLTPWFSNSYAIVIGINSYTNWPTNSYAVNDAQGVAQYLLEQGFTVISLLDSNATKAAIISAVEDQLAPKLAPNDRVFFFFAGHGATRRLGNGDRAYIVPYDGATDFGSLITMSEIRDWSSALGVAKHQMFLLDSCFGGSIATRASTVTVTQPGTPEYVEDVTTRRARQALTAGGANQKVVDGGPNGHSLFTGQLLKALREGLADQDGDGYITFTELVSYMQPAASQYNQTPGPCELVGHEQGNFIFINPIRRVISQRGPGSRITPGALRSSGDVYESLKAGKRLFAQKNYPEAFHKFQEAASLGNAEAMTFLGKLYFEGLGTALNLDKAIECFLAGAQSGEVLAMKNLVAIYSVDYGPNIDPSRVLHLRNPEEANRWKLALAEAENWNQSLVQVSPTGSAKTGETTIPPRDVLVRPPSPPTHLRIVSGP